MAGILSKLQQDSFNIGKYKLLSEEYVASKMSNLLGFGFPEIYALMHHDLFEVMFISEANKEIFASTLPSRLQNKRMSKLEAYNTLVLALDSYEDISLFQDMKYRNFNYGEELITNLYKNLPSARKDVHSIYKLTVEEYENAHYTGLNTTVLEKMLTVLYELIKSYRKMDIPEFKLSNTVRFIDIVEKNSYINKEIKLVEVLNLDQSLEEVGRVLSERIKELESGRDYLVAHLNRYVRPSIYKEIPAEIYIDKEGKPITGEDAIKVEKKYLTEKAKDLGRELRKQLNDASNVVPKFISNNYLDRYRNGEYHPISEFKEYYTKFNKVKSNEIESKLNFNIYVQTERTDSTKSKSVKNYEVVLTDIEGALNLENEKLKYINYLLNKEDEPVKHGALYFKYLN